MIEEYILFCFLIFIYWLIGAVLQTCILRKEYEPSLQNCLVSIVLLSWIWPFIILIGILGVLIFVWCKIFNIDTSGWDL